MAAMWIDLVVVAGFFARSVCAARFRQGAFIAVAAKTTKQSRGTTMMTTLSRVVSVSEWMPLNPESLVAAPCLVEQTLCQPQSDDGQQPQLAKDVPYAQAVLDAWGMEEESSSSGAWETEWCHIQYHDGDGKDTSTTTTTSTPLYGHLIRRAPGKKKTMLSSSLSNRSRSRAGVVFFHTAAGPHDLFLLYKAASFVNSYHDQKKDDNVMVLIADVLSDESGWAWKSRQRDHTRYNEVRDKILLDSGRTLLRRRVQAAFETLQQQILRLPLPNNYDNDTDNDTDCKPLVKLAALGWCLGGHAILEAAKLQDSRLVALGTFHGVFDGAYIPPTTTNDHDKPKLQMETEALLCHGTNDPFVSNESLEEALRLLQILGYRTSLLQLDGAKHGFTNPAQAFNTDAAAFAYDPQAADKAWKQTLNMLQRTLC